MSLFARCCWVSSALCWVWAASNPVKDLSRSPTTTMCVSLLLLAVKKPSIASTFGLALLMGTSFALGYAGRMLFSLRLPKLVSLALAGSQTLVWALFAVGAWRLWILPWPFNVLFISCLGTALFWIEWSLLPLWGTAQNFACSSSVNHPFIAWFGTAGGTWSALLLACLMAQAESGWSTERVFWISSVVGIGIIAVLMAVNHVVSTRISQTLRVAVFGWAGNDFDALTDIPAEFQTAARKASEQGARLLVTPEAAMRVEDRAHFRVALCTLALKYNLALAVGYFDRERNENCIDFVSARGEVVARYVKTHLVPVFERYQKGRGEVALMDVDGIKVGGLICQDDNFPDIARKYGRAGAQLLAIPTNDWRGVKDVHFANHRWRALENRFALARATSDGVSALTSASGEVLKSSDHFKDGAQLLVGDVSVGNGKPTLYARTGDWFPVACGVAAIVGLWLAR